MSIRNWTRLLQAASLGAAFALGGLTAIAIAGRVAYAVYKRETAAGLAAAAEARVPVCVAGVRGCTRHQDIRMAAEAKAEHADADPDPAEVAGQAYRVANEALNEAVHAEQLLAARRGARVDTLDAMTDPPLAPPHPAWCVCGHDGCPGSSGHLGPGPDPGPDGFLASIAHLVPEERDYAEEDANRGLLEET